MSHFTVVVRIPGALVSELGIEAALKKMLAPYQENNMGDCPREFLAFHDVEDEHKMGYETESVEMIRCEDGELRLPWDERFRVHGTFGTGSDTHNPPAQLERVQVPFREKYATLGDFITDWCGYKRDEETGRFGYWENPNKKWDWYSIGGRWSGFFPLKDPATATLGRKSVFADDPTPGHGDICRLSDIDTDAMEASAREAFAKWWGEFEEYRKDPRKHGGYHGPRGMAMDVGLVVVRRGPPEPGEEARAHRWSDLNQHLESGDERLGWHDVISDVTREDAEKLTPCLCPSVPYAVLDSDGWRAPGEMGWFGCSSDSPESLSSFKIGYLDWLKSTPSDDALVMVDCHI